MTDQPEKPLRRQMIEKMSALMTSAFGLVAALAWNDAIKALFKQIFPDQESAQVAILFVYAGVVTVAAVVATTWIGRLAQRVEDLEKKYWAEERAAGGAAPDGPPPAG